MGQCCSTRDANKIPETSLLAPEMELVTRLSNTNPPIIHSCVERYD